MIKFRNWILLGNSLCRGVGRPNSKPISLLVSSIVLARGIFRQLSSLDCGCAASYELIHVRRRRNQSASVVANYHAGSEQEITAAAQPAFEPNRPSRSARVLLGGTARHGLGWKGKTVGLNKFPGRVRCSVASTTAGETYFREYSDNCSHPGRESSDRESCTFRNNFVRNPNHAKRSLFWFVLCELSCLEITAKSCLMIVVFVFMLGRLRSSRYAPRFLRSRRRTCR